MSRRRAFPCYRLPAWLAAALVVFAAACGSAGAGAGEGGGDVIPDATRSDATRADAALPDTGDATDAADAAGTGDATDAADAAGSGDAGPVRPEYPLDETLRLHHVQMKGTHNSYHVAPSQGVVAEWNYTHAPLYEQLDVQGVRQFELDVHYHGAEGFRVYHVAIIDEQTTCRTLAACLGELRRWSDGHPGHHALVVVLEAKSATGGAPIQGHYEELEAEILGVWPRERILTPDDVRGTHPTLREALAEDGWPTLAETRDRVLFVLISTSREPVDHTVEYAALHPGLEGALLFVRSDDTTLPHAAVVEFGDARGHEDELRALATQGFLLRSAADSTDPENAPTNPERRDAALDAGVHLVNTDFAAPPAEGSDGYWLDLPGGAPSRCNPVTAPPECTAAAIEAL